ncbi:cell surface protein [Bifidobacterium longum]|uniref:cell surface protein n=1 Tax=Bifidobacterium longum TaxID=216816 RepID=UPI000E53D0FF|nr:cell surface protein [Bifidobacterium longum]RGJ78709.1 cell surface protein [Bifidobacterium longum]
MGRNNNPTRGSTIRHVVRTIAAASATVATLAAGMLVAGTADAADMRDPFERSIQNGNPGLWANMGTITFSNGHKYEDMEQSLGVVDKVNGKNVYCIQADTLYTGTAGTWGEWTDAKTKPDAQRLAWLTDKYNGNTDDLTQAAIAGLIHQKLDPMGEEYLKGIERLGWKDGTSWDTYTKKMNELWNEAVANTPSNLDMRYQYTIGQRKGTIDVGIQNGNGGFLSGITYTATLKGPAVFDQTGKNTISGTTTNSAQHVAWTATGNGKVMPVFNYKVPKAAKLSSPNQNLMAATDPETVSKNIQFEVLNNFKPTIESNQTDHRIEYGHAPEDDLTWHVDPSGGDWIEGATIKSTGTLYYFAKKPVEGQTTVKDGVKAATATVTGDKDGATNHVDAASITMDPDFVKTHPGATPSSLPDTGWYTWVWQITPDMQDANMKQYLSTDYDWSDNVLEAETTLHVRNMQPTITSSVSAAYKTDQSKVTGADGIERPAVQIGSAAASDRTDVVYLEKGGVIRDKVTLGVSDVNGDGKTDTADWLHTKDGQGEGRETEANQITIRVNGTLYGGMTREQAEQAQKDAASGKTVELPRQAVKLATTTFTTNKAGDYLLSSRKGEKPAGVWKAENGIDLTNPPSGYATFVYDIANRDQDTKNQTGIEPSRDYPFAKDVHEAPFTADETVMFRLTPKLDSTVSSKEVKAGETTVDKLVVAKTNEKDVWPTYPETNVTEGETPKGTPLSLDFHGVLYKVSDDPSAAIEETDTVPENAVKVHETDIKDVTKFGTYTTDSFTLTESGTYAWHWVMTPSLTGDQNHNPLAALAWRQLTHGKVQHAFGLASEIVRVRKPETPKCEVSTKSQGEVTFENGKADLHDELLLKNCSDAAKAEFELWRQADGDQSGDVLITVTGKVDAKDGIHSPTVTVHETGTYYWREKVYDQTGKLISYGDARKPNETVLVKEKGLASTGVGTPMLLWAGVLAGAGIALALAGSRKRIRL